LKEIYKNFYSVQEKIEEFISSKRKRVPKKGKISEGKQANKGEKACV
jgi:hypothetical protein